MKNPLHGTGQRLLRVGAGIREALDTRPTIATIPLGLIVLGMVALVRGDHVSRAFTDLGGSFLVRFLGASMVLGGILFAASLPRGDAAVESMGLAVTTLGCFMYGVGVIAGLGEQGIMAGGGFLLISAGFLLRIRMVIRKGRAAQQSP
jgi:hypothetical protein